MRKNYNINNVTLELETNKFVKGFILKRKVTTREARYIMKNIFGIDINNLEDCYDKEEYADYNENLTNCMNNWLVGNVDDSSIMEYAYDCADECLGLFNCIPLVVYLQKNEII